MNAWTQKKVHRRLSVPAVPHAPCASLWLPTSSVPSRGSACILGNSGRQKRHIGLCFLSSSPVCSHLLPASATRLGCSRGHARCAGGAAPPGRPGIGVPEPRKSDAARRADVACLPETANGAPLMCDEIAHGCTFLAQGRPFGQPNRELQCLRPAMAAPRFRASPRFAGVAIFSRARHARNEAGERPAWKRALQRKQQQAIG
jgi:hypothetical protein